MAYARQHFGRFQASQLPAIQRLMGALVFAKRAAAGRPNPYADLMAEDLWGNLGGCSGCWRFRGGGMSTRCTGMPARVCAPRALQAEGRRPHFNPRLTSGCL